MAANHAFVYMGRADTLISIPHDILAPLAAEYAVRVLDEHCSFAHIHLLSTQQFKRVLNEGRLGNAQGGTLQIYIVWMHESHQEWLKTFSKQEVKVHLMYPHQKEKAFRLQQSIGRIFSFKEKLSVLNLQQPADITSTSMLEVLPERFLLADLADGIDIFKVEKSFKVRIYHSDLDEPFHLAIIQQVLAKHHPQSLLLPVNQIITKTVLEGNIENSDLLIQDIFGKEGCSFIGLPPKLIAASLGKLNSEREKSGLWDRLKSVVFAFGINLGKQINHQVLATKITSTVLFTHEITSPHFLQIVDVDLSLFSRQHRFVGNYGQTLVGCYSTSSQESTACYLLSKAHTKCKVINDEYTSQ